MMPQRKDSQMNKAPAIYGRLSRNGRKPFAFTPFRPTTDEAGGPLNIVRRGLSDAPTTFDR